MLLHLTARLLRRPFLFLRGGLGAEDPIDFQCDLRGPILFYFFSHFKQEKQTEGN